MWCSNAVYNPAETGLERRHRALCANEVEAAVRNGAVLLVLSDKAISKEMKPDSGAFVRGRGANAWLNTNSALRCRI